MYSTTTKTAHGVAIIMKAELVKYLEKVTRYKDKAIHLRLKMDTASLNIICIYSPQTIDLDFLQTIFTWTNNCLASNEHLIILGDYNEVHEDRDSIFLETTGPFKAGHLDVKF